MNFVKENWLGILICLVIAIPAYILGLIFPIVGGPVFAIIAGMVITIFYKNKTKSQSGITFIIKKHTSIRSNFIGFLYEPWKYSKNRSSVIADYFINYFNIANRIFCFI